MRAREVLGILALAAMLLPACKDEEEACGDGVDNDDDGFVDCEDDECSDDPACDEAPVEDCADGTDDDGDGLVDCDDTDCADDPVCVDEDCGNGVDDDGDGDVDCDDADCVGDDACASEGDCFDGNDDDGDGLVDCDDPDCSTEPACGAEICDNELDDDGDGDADCLDPDCRDAEACDAYGDYFEFDGYEFFQYGVGHDGPGAVSCYVFWDVTGTRVPLCPDCLFTFETEHDFNDRLSFDDGSYLVCPNLSQDFSYVYGYTENYLGADGTNYGPYLIYEYEGAFIGWAPASFDGTTFRYGEGYIDYYYAGTYGYYPEYAGTYLTNYYGGQAIVK